MIAPTGRRKKVRSQYGDIRDAELTESEGSLRRNMAEAGVASGTWNAQ
jgi:hypothetical protein